MEAAKITILCSLTDLQSSILFVLFFYHGLVIWRIHASLPKWIFLLHFLQELILTLNCSNYFFHIVTGLSSASDSARLQLNFYFCPFSNPPIGTVYLQLGWDENIILEREYFLYMSQFHKLWQSYVGRFSIWLFLHSKYNLFSEYFQYSFTLRPKEHLKSTRTDFVILTSAS